MKLEDIKLKTGDIIKVSNDYSMIVEDALNNVNMKDYLSSSIYYSSEIISIKRPLGFETLYEKPKEILTNKEKKYLEAVCKPFKDRVKRIAKSSYCGDGFTAERIMFYYMDIHNEYVSFALPMFRKDTMYKGMEWSKEYTLKELGLFEE